MKKLIIAILTFLLILTFNSSIVFSKIKPNSKIYKIVKGVLIKYYGVGEKITIPSSVLTIGNEAFLNCKSIRTVNIPHSVKSIREGAFIKCGLTSIIIPESVKSIGSTAFGKTNIESIVLPRGISKISDWTFESCLKLKKVDIPSNIKSIDEYAFAGCSSLKTVNIQRGIKFIRFDAFANCSSLSSITIPDSVEIIDDYAFAGCVKLRKIIISDKKENLEFMSSSAFYGCDRNNLTIFGHNDYVKLIARKSGFNYEDLQTHIRYYYGNNKKNIKNDVQKKDQKDVKNNNIKSSENWGFYTWIILLSFLIFSVSIFILFHQSNKKS